jgi:cytochrome c biogenesis protein CcmG/thiol:disulfide interchange protein DsbE
MLLRAWILVPAVGFVGLLTFGLLRSGGTPGIGDTAPDFTAERLNGNGTLSLGELRGRPVLLNFWASWCVPCEDEGPMLRAGFERYGNQVHFVGVDIRDARGDAKEFVRRHGLDYEHVRDERLQIYDDYGLTGQPETFLIDAKGTIVQHISGPLLSEDDLVGLLEELVTSG